MRAVAAGKMYATPKQHAIWWKQSARPRGRERLTGCVAPWRRAEQTQHRSGRWRSKCSRSGTSLPSARRSLPATAIRRCSVCRRLSLPLPVVPAAPQLLRSMRACTSVCSVPLTSIHPSACTFPSFALLSSALLLRSLTMALPQFSCRRSTPFMLPPARAMHTQSAAGSATLS